MAEYIIIAAARDEAQLIRYTLESVIAQRVRPVEFIIVNDGSTDGTDVIIKAYTQKYTWIHCVDLPDRGLYKYGDGIIQAFYAGFKKIKSKNYKFIVKLDCDLSFDEYYFENLLKEFSGNPNLGIASGQTYYLNRRGKLVWEDAPLDHTVGPSKVYRRECFEAINGLKISLGWDHIDEVTARMKGWETRSYPNFKLLHHRVMGSRLGILKGLMRHGHADYITGYHPVYFFAKTIYRVFSRPLIVGSAASFWGFFKSYATATKRIVDRDVIQFYRTEQLNKLKQLRFWKLYLIKYKFIKE